MLGSARATGAVILMLLVSGLIAAPVARAESGYRYWTFWVSEGDEWRFATEGPATTRTQDGDVVGWRFAITTASGTADAQPGTTPADAFASACSTVTAPDGEHRVALVLDYGTVESAPEGEMPPAARTECVITADGSTAAQSLSAIATLRIDQGFVCGVDGYPAAECAPAVDLPTTVPSAAPVPTPDSSVQAAPAEGASDGGLPGSLIVFAVLILAALVGIALLVTRRRTP